MYVDEVRCTGCGLCTDVCPTGAISVVDGVARVEQSLCQECEACLSACPNGALLALQEPARAEKPAPVRAPAPSPIPVRPVAPAPRPNTGVWPWLGAALYRAGGGAPRGGAFWGTETGATRPGALISCRRSTWPRGLWQVGQRPARTPPAASTLAVWLKDKEVA